MPRGGEQEGRAMAYYQRSETRTRVATTGVRSEGSHTRTVR